MSMNVVKGCALRLRFNGRTHGYGLRLKWKDKALGIIFKQKFKENFNQKLENVAYISKFIFNLRF
jgi:hypothetical protein